MEVQLILSTGKGLQRNLTAMVVVAEAAVAVVAEAVVVAAAVTEAMLAVAETTEERVKESLHVLTVVGEIIARDLANTKRANVIPVEKSVIWRPFVSIKREVLIT